MDRFLLFNLFNLVVVLCTPFVAHAEPSPEARQKYRECVAEYKLSHYAEAIRLCEDAYRLSPSSVVILFTIGQGYRRLGDEDKALALFRQFLDGAEGSKDPKILQVRDEARMIVAQLEGAASARQKVQNGPPFSASPSIPEEKGPSGARGETPPRAITTSAESQSAQPTKFNTRSALIAGTTLSVIGLAALSAGGGVLARSSQLFDAAAMANTADSRDALSEESSVSRVAGWTTIGIGIAAAVGAGIAWGLYGRAVSSRRSSIAFRRMVWGGGF